MFEREGVCWSGSVLDFLWDGVWSRGSSFDDLLVAMSDVVSLSVSCVLVMYSVSMAPLLSSLLSGCEVEGGGMRCCCVCGSSEF